MADNKTIGVYYVDTTDLEGWTDETLVDALRDPLGELGFEIEYGDSLVNPVVYDSVDYRGHSGVVQFVEKIIEIITSDSATDITNMIRAVKSYVFDWYVIYHTEQGVYVCTDDEYEQEVLEWADYDEERVDRSGYDGTIKEFIECLPVPCGSDMHRFTGIHDSNTVEFDDIREYVESWEGPDKLIKYVLGEIDYVEAEQ
jgi:hypothetical protein